MANGYREGIPGIIGSGYLGQAQQMPDHHLHLAFFCSAIADNCAFDFKWRVFENGKPLLRRHQQGHTSGMAQLQCRLNVHSMKNPLDGHGVDFLA